MQKSSTDYLKCASESWLRTCSSAHAPLPFQTRSHTHTYSTHIHTHTPDCSVKKALTGLLIPPPKLVLSGSRSANIATPAQCECIFCRATVCGCIAHMPVCVGDINQTVVKRAFCFSTCCGVPVLWCHRPVANSLNELQEWLWVTLLYQTCRSNTFSLKKNVTTLTRLL